MQQSMALGRRTVSVSRGTSERTVVAYACALGVNTNPDLAADKRKRLAQDRTIQVESMNASKTLLLPVQPL